MINFQINSLQSSTNMPILRNVMYPLDCSADIYVLYIGSELKLTLLDDCYCNHEIIPVH